MREAILVATCLVALHGVLAAQSAASGKPVPEVATIEGRVLDTNWQPIVGADISYKFVGGVEGVEEPSTTTNRNGRFRLTVNSGLIPGKRTPGMPSLIAKAPGTASAWAQLDLKLYPYGSLVSRCRVPDLVLPPGRTIVGQVRAAARRKVVGADVSCVGLLMKTVQPPHVWSLAAYTVTDEEGVFRLEGASLGPLRVSVQAAGFCSQDSLVITGEESLTFDLVETGTTNGTVLGVDGKGMPCWLLVHYQAMQFPQLLRATADGCFSLPLWKSGPYRVVAVCDDRKVLAASDVLEGQKGDLILKGREETANELIVHVKGPDKRPAKGAKAYVWWRDAIPPQNRPGLLSLIAVNGNGKGTLTLPGPTPADRTSGTLAVGAENCAWHWQEVSWKPQGNARQQELPVALRGEARLKGRVVWEKSNEAVADARVWATVAMGPQGVFMDGDHPYGVEDHVASDGSFDLKGLASGRYDLYGFRGGSPLAVLKAVEVPPAGKNDVQLEMPGGCLVQGRMTPPVPPGWCFLASQGRIGTEHVLWRGDVVQFAPDAEGKFRLQAPRRKKCTVAVAIPMPPHYGSLLLIQLPTQAAEKEKTHWRIESNKARPGAVVGKVSCPVPEFPLARLAVLSHEDEGASYKPHYWHHRGRSGVGSKGTFSLWLPPGRHTLEIVDLVTNVRLWRSEKRLQIAAGKESELEIDLNVGAIDLHLVEKKGQATPVALAVAPEGWSGQWDELSEDTSMPIPSTDRQLILVPAGRGRFYAETRGLSREEEDAFEKLGDYKVAIGEKVEVKLAVPGLIRVR